MKTLFITGVTVAAIAFSACNGNNNNTSKQDSSNATTAKPSEAAATEIKSKSPLKDLTTTYLQIKDGLANDNGDAAATGGNAFVDALGKIDKSSMNADQKKAFEDIADDAKEMAEHIGKNAGKIEHQRAF